MPCWPDASEHVQRISAIIRGLAPPLAYIAVVAFLLWAPAVRRAGLRMAFRILGAVGVVPLIVALPAALFGVALHLGDPPAQVRLVRSADGQEATLRYDSGFLGRDYTEVTLKQPDSCRHTTVFYHFGPSEFSDPKLEWASNQVLRIRYHTRSGDPDYCETRVENTKIVCEASLWPSSTTSP